MYSADKNLLNPDTEEVRVGSTIDFSISRKNKESHYKAYTLKEALSSKGHEISVSSPIGKALLWKKEGDSIPCNIEDTDYIINIVKVH